MSSSSSSAGSASAPISSQPIANELFADVIIKHYNNVKVINESKQAAEQKALSIKSEKERFVKAKKDLLARMPLTIKVPILSQAGSDDHDEEEIRAWAESNRKRDAIGAFVSGASLGTSPSFSMIKGPSIRSGPAAAELAAAESLLTAEQLKRVLLVPNQELPAFVSECIASQSKRIIDSASTGKICPSLKLLKLFPNKQPLHAGFWSADLLPGPRYILCVGQNATDAIPGHTFLGIITGQVKKGHEHASEYADTLHPLNCCYSSDLFGSFKENGGIMARGNTMEDNHNVLVLDNAKRFNEFRFLQDSLVDPLNKKSLYRPPNVVLAELIVGVTPCIAVFSLKDLSPYEELVHDAGEDERFVVRQAARNQEVCNNLNARVVEIQQECEDVKGEVENLRQAEQRSKSANVDAMTAAVKIQRWLDRKLGHGASRTIIPTHVPGSLNPAIVKKSKILQLPIAAVAPSAASPAAVAAAAVAAAAAGKQGSQQQQRQQPLSQEEQDKNAERLAVTLSKLQEIVNGNDYQPNKPVSQKNNVVVWRANDACKIHKSVEKEHGKEVADEMRRSWQEKNDVGFPSKTKEVVWNIEENRMMTPAELVILLAANVIKGFDEEDQEELGMDDTDSDTDDEDNGVIDLANESKRGTKRKAKKTAQASQDSQIKEVKRIHKILETVYNVKNNSNNNNQQK